MNDIKTGSWYGDSGMMRSAVAALIGVYSQGTIVSFCPGIEEA